MLNSQKILCHSFGLSCSWTIQPKLQCRTGSAYTLCELHKVWFAKGKHIIIFVLFSAGFPFPFLKSRCRSILSICHWSLLTSN